MISNFIEKQRGFQYKLFHGSVQEIQWRTKDTIGFGFENKKRRTRPVNENVITSSHQSFKRELQGLDLLGAYKAFTNLGRLLFVLF